MDFSSSFLKSYGPSEHCQRISAGNLEEEKQKEHSPILSDHHPGYYHAISTTPADPDEHQEFIVDIDSVSRDNNPPVRRDSSYEFWTDDRRSASSDESQGLDMLQMKVGAEDPPSKLISQFLRKQKAAGTDTPLDADLEMDEFSFNFRRSSSNASPGGESDSYIVAGLSSSEEVRVSFRQAPSSATNLEKQSKDKDWTSDKGDHSNGDYNNGVPQCQWRRSNDDTVACNIIKSGDEVLKCTSFQRRPIISRMKTKSRLIDEPEHEPEPDRKSPQKLCKASGLLGKAGDEEEDDPLFDEDLPDDFKDSKFNKLTLIQWISLVLIVTVLCCTLVISDLNRREFRGLELWKWEVLVLVLICGRLVSGWVIKIAVLLIERNFMLRKKVLYFVYGLRKAVQNCIWLGLVLAAWRCFFDRTVDGHNDFLSFVNKFMLWMLVVALLWLLKTLMVKVLASSFHVNTFFDRIQESIFNQYVIETLSGTPLIEVKNNLEDEGRTTAELQQLQNAGAVIPPELRATASVKSGKMMSEPQTKICRVGSCIRVSGPLNKRGRRSNGAAGCVDDVGMISIDHLHRLNTKNISAWKMKRLIRIIRHGVLSTIDEHNGDHHHHAKEEDSANQIRSEFEAKLAARKIFRNVARPYSKFIYLDDLMRFMIKDEAVKTMNLMKGSPESDKINKRALKNWVVEAFRERKALALTLNDAKTAVNKLHRIINVLVGIVVVIIFLIILDIATSKFLLFLSSQVVVVAFIFGNTCKTIFEAIVFLFVMHPFDVGDRCEIDGVQVVVEEMNILTTVFLRFDNQKIIYPNSTLATKSIGNYYRSPDMGDTIDFLVHIATPADKIALMKQRITSYIENKKDSWYGSPSVLVMNMEGLSSIKMSVWLRHRMNHQNMGDRWQRRAVVMEEMVKIFKELDMEYRLYPLDINVRSLPSTVNSTRFPSTWSPPKN